jgi:hypothetical protein
VPAHHSRASSTLRCLVWAAITHHPPSMMRHLPDTPCTPCTKHLEISMHQGGSTHTTHNLTRTRHTTHTHTHEREREREKNRKGNKKAGRCRLRRDKAKAGTKVVFEEIAVEDAAVPATHVHPALVHRGCVQVPRRGARAMRLHQLPRARSCQTSPPPSESDRSHGTRRHTAAWHGNDRRGCMRTH